MVVGHRDNTSKSVYGDYPHVPPDPVRPTYGHSKEHRDDLKQIVFELVVNREGVPLLGEVRDGNTSEKKLNGDSIEALCATFSPEALCTIVYVADSQLVTGPNLEKLAKYKIPFISRLPDTYRHLAEQVKAAAWQGPWIPIGPISPQKGAAHYFASEQQGEIDGRTYRLVVYRSSHLDARKAKALERQLEQERKALQAEADQLARKTFACREDAQVAAEAWLSTHAQAFHDLSATVEEHQVLCKRSRRGRPAKGEAPTYTTVYGVHPCVGPRNPDRVQAEQQRRSTFIRITVLSRDEWPADRLLQEYKLQVKVEQRFTFLKDPMFVDAFFLHLHKPERTEALGYVLLMALLVFSLLERRARRSNVPIHTPTRRQLTHPTGNAILRNLEGVQVVRVSQDRREVRPSPSFKKTFHQILKATGFSEDIYTRVPPRAPG